MKDKTIVQIQSDLEMVGFLKANGTQCRFVSMLSETPVVKMKVSSPYKGVLKVSRKFGMINANYNTSVRNRIALRLGVALADVEYVNGSVWYEHEKTVDGKNLPLVRHADPAKKDEYYLQYFPTRSENAYRMPDGTPVTQEQLAPYLYKESARPDWKPCVISIKVSNIKRLSASGVIMETEDVEDAEASLANA